MTLTRQTRRDFGQKLLPLADRCISTVQHLIDEGFERFRIEREFDELHCSQQEYQDSLEIRLELAKEMISSSFARVIETDVASDNYVSALLARLRTERNEAGYDRSWLVKGDGERWMYEIDPAKRRSIQMVLNQSIFSREISAYRKAKETAQISEREDILAKRGLTEFIPSSPITTTFMARVRGTIDAELIALSFQPERKLSKLPNMLQYTMPLSGSNQLRFIVVMAPSMFEARLFLVKESLGKKFDGNWGEWYSSHSAFEIRLWDIIPWFGNSICPDIPTALVRFYAYLSVLKLGIPCVLSASANEVDLGRR